MVRRMKCGISLLSAFFLFFLLASTGRSGLGVVAGAINLCWALTERGSVTLRRFLPHLFLVVNTLFAAYGSLQGAEPALALGLVGTSLLAWNGALFLARWNNPPPEIETRYIQRLTWPLGVGIGMAGLALDFQGAIDFPFPLAFASLILSGALWMRLWAQAAGPPR
jgi:hypothetical protein